MVRSKRSFGDDAVLRHHRPDQHSLGGLRLQPGLRHHRHGEGVTNLNSFVGGLNKAFLSGLTPDSLIGAFPESVFIVFQMTFAIITPA